VLTLVFLTLLAVLVVIVTYLYRNKGSYLTYEQPAVEADMALPLEDAAPITLVFLTLLAVLVVIVTYLYRNKGSYLTYEQPAVEADMALPLEDAPAKEKEEYFI
ncbi:PREDICTED: small cell adhesion glycoprotein, partial [Buceros rhinoceros silvestris]|uniref:small cell adhesion glycoprotein n=1 Tax=Buceros rhinoceros silvestris TaxID=175836 RepID=UPI0005291B7D